jgi:hypothetical protein
LAKSLSAEANAEKRKTSAESESHTKNYSKHDWLFFLLVVFSGFAFY